MFAPRMFIRGISGSRKIGVRALNPNLSRKGGAACSFPENCSDPFIGYPWRMRLTLDQLIVPQDFPPHAPPAAPEAAAYAQKATTATKEEAEKGLKPERVAYGPDPTQ